MASNTSPNGYDTGDEGLSGTTTPYEETKIHNVDVTGVAEGSVRHAETVGVVYGDLHVNERRTITATHVDITETCSVTVQGNKVQSREDQHRQQHERQVITKDADVFVKTTGYHKAKECLDNKHVVAITGFPGTGKTASAYQLLRDLKDQYDIFIVQKPKEVNFKEQPTRARIYLVNDIFGESVFSVLALERWKNLLASFFKSGDRKLSDKVKLIVTSRTSIFNEALTYVDFQSFSADTMVDLSAQTPLSKAEKREMVHNHMSRSQIELPDSTVDSICDMSIPYGFPHTCFLFFKLKQFHHEPMSFFRDPLPCLNNSLSDLCLSEPKLYACLLLLLLSDDEVHVERLSYQADTLERVFQKVQDVSIGDIEKCFRGSSPLDGPFIRKDVDVVTFSHPSIKNAVSYLVGTTDPQFIIDNCSFQFVFDRVRIHDQKAKERKRGTFEDRNMFELYLSKEWHEFLACRFVQGILNTEYPLICAHQALAQRIFVKKLLEKSDLMDCFKCGSPDQHFSKSILHWSVWNKSDYLCKTLLKSFSFSNRCLLDATSASVHSGNFKAFKHLLQLIPRPHLLKHFADQWQVQIQTDNSDKFRETPFTNEYHGDTMITLACRLGRTYMVKVLLEHGFSIHDRDAYGNSPLHKGCSGNNVHLVVSLLELGAKPDHTNMHSQTPLHVASQHGRSVFVNLLLKYLSKHANIAKTDKQAYVNLADDEEHTSLMTACEHGHVATVQALLAVEADISATGKHGDSALMISCKRGPVRIIELLIEKGADVNATNSTGATALMVACDYDNVEAAEVLLNIGADVNVRNIHGNTALLLALSKSSQLLCERLIRHDADVHVKDFLKRSFLMLACSKGYGNVVQLAIERNAVINIDTNGHFHPLYISVQKCHDEIVKILLSNGADANVRDSEGVTPLLLACEKDDENIVKLLIDHNACINICDPNGFSPLMYECMNAHDEIVQCLLSLGAKVNCSNDEGNTPIMLASERGSSGIVEMLLSHGAEVNATNTKGNSALLLACSQNRHNVVEILLSKGADVELQNGDLDSPLTLASGKGYFEIVEILSRHGTVLNSNKPLIAACLEGHEQIVAFLCSHQADVNMGDQENFTSLMASCESGSVKCVETLLQYGANINAQADSGDSPLHVASMHGSAGVVNVLLKDRTIQYLHNTEGHTPLMLAYLEDHPNSAESLIAWLKAQNQLTDCEFQTIFNWTCTKGYDKLLRVILSDNVNLGNFKIGKHSLGFGPNSLDSLDIGGYNLDNLEHGRDSLDDLDIALYILDHPEIVQNSLEHSESEMYSPLEWAIKHGHVRVAKVLLEHGVSACATSDHEDPLLTACKRLDETLADLLLYHNANVNVQDEDGNTPLMLACKNGTKQMVVMLLRYDAEVNTRNVEGNTPLLLACHRDDDCSTGISEILLDLGAQVNVTDNSANTPLLVACRKRENDIDHNLLKQPVYDKNTERKQGSAHLISILLRQDHVNVDVNAVNMDGDSALLAACRGGNVRIVNLLLKHGAKVDACDINKNTPLHLACERGFTNVVRMLMSHHADPNALNAKEETPLLLASRTGYVRIAQDLLENGAQTNVADADNYTPLLFACQTGDSALVEILLKFKADIEVVDACGKTPLNLACGEGHFQIVKKLLKYSQKVNVTDDFGNTPLWYACMKEGTGIAALLLSQGADARMADGSGVTPLLLACDYSDAQTIRLLLEHNAQVDVGRRTPLIAACEREDLEILQLLIDHGADLQRADDIGSTPLMIACEKGMSIDVFGMLLRHGAHVNSADEHNETPLHIACGGGDLQKIRRLLEKGAIVNATDDFSNTPLILACQKSDDQAVRLLIDHMADVNVQDSKGRTALMLACTQGNIHIVDLLLKQGSDPNIADQGGITPLIESCSKANSQIVQSLLSHDADVNLSLGNTAITPLNVALAHSHDSIVEIMLQHGAVC
ncbi:ankyrin repeat and KH domain-containing protein 1-like [Haliotis cracherodii]|uniref:ankyrin repeat and KH domain-containing protein 1-like n=1 Tax=Haliotis cracherodii TaxID=6455 RepID=UPI0039EC4F3D